MAASTRSRSGSVQYEDLKLLLSRLEENLTLQISKVVERIENFEKALDSVHSNQIRLDNEIDEIKKVTQQEYIERLEVDKRMNNVVIRGIPESSVPINDVVTLTSDIAKVKFMNDLISEEAGPACIESVSRLGRKLPGKDRQLFVKFTKRSSRNDFLFKQKTFRQDEGLKRSFGLIYVNRDSTFLVRQEEKRLRDKMKSMRPTLTSNDSFYLKSGKLHLNDSVIDSIDISNQLF